MKGTEFLSKLLLPNPIKCNINRALSIEKNEESHTYVGGNKGERKRHGNGAYPIMLLA